MRIAFILPSLANKGPNIVAQSIVNGLVDNFDKVHVFYFDESKTKLSFKCSVKRISESENIEFSEYDIIHSHTMRCDIYLYRRKKKLKGVKIVSTIHQDIYKTFKLRYNFITANILSFFWIHILKKFNNLVTISNELINCYEKSLPNTKLIYNGVNLMDNELDKNLVDIFVNLRSCNYKILCTYASITKGKGIDQLINVLKEVDDFALVIIGEGAYKDILRDRVNLLNLSDRVKFYSYIECPYNYLDLVDLYLMPSYFEGFGLALVEAALKKKAIVCSRISAFLEIFPNNEVVFFENDDENSLINAISEAFTNKDYYGNKAYNRALNDFTSDIMCQNYFYFYKNVYLNSIYETY